ncbi:phosphotransferase [Allostreptomyces psammosilenae]|uniref:Aminoglycoside phosphotransferase domain-containing protein n=1 Tax=Allostreptomyces psammosilenae TaxID=1892865 RepID=A0A852ZXU4_9ACTN|nr:phosphotransferase [Allostreptomyces psammosilenae]NYI05544.1 hypothetical protein [Allostreptomyces psammosilenae]
MAAHLGDVHGAAWSTELRHASLGAPHRLNGEYAIRDFITPRRHAIEQRHRTGYLPDARRRWAAHTLLERVEDLPAAFYKDTNPRNVLVTAEGGLVTLDVDDLTLAPFGYDLAKLVVTLAMTHGRIPLAVIVNALATYNAAADAHHPGLGAVALPLFLAFAELHSILTAPYLGRGGYRNPWESVRPDTAYPLGGEL